MSSLPPTDWPLCEVSTWVKQVAADQLTSTARKVLDAVCPQFSSRFPHWDESALAQLVNYHVGGRERRFAGDDSLPRGRYYSLCGADGEDHGTLLLELLAYSANSVVAPCLLREVDIASEMVPDEALVVERPTEGRAIRIGLPTLEGKPHPYVQSLGIADTGNTVFIYLPVRVLNVTIQSVVDLRMPDVGTWFARYFSTLTTEILGASISCWPKRPPLARFDEILPSLFTLRLGGDDFTKNVGLHLRKKHVHALLYPSVRMDCGVIVENGKVVEWAGWHLVDYRGTAAPEPGVHHVNDDDFWPTHPGLANPIGQATPTPRLSFLDLGIHHFEEEDLRGSWKVHGLTGYTTRQRLSEARFKPFNAAPP